MTEKESAAKAIKRAETAKSNNEENLRNTSAMVEQIKQEMTAETQNHKFSLELEY